ncbi:hypothetical protein ACFV7R_45255 [Streptomyces sp. NPDC059866]|uniref:hypothetical protein n=1 Tax=Streptomyces sp. NPDC059866 TaxID=3346978 RepID=UPI00365C2459
MPSYQLRDTATQQFLARDLADYPAAEAALDHLHDELNATSRPTAKAPGASGCASTSRRSPPASPRPSATTCSSSA